MIKYEAFPCTNCPEAMLRRMPIIRSEAEIDTLEAQLHHLETRLGKIGTGLFARTERASISRKIDSAEARLQTAHEKLAHAQQSIEVAKECAGPFERIIATENGEWRDRICAISVNESELYGEGLLLAPPQSDD